MKKQEVKDLQDEFTNLFDSNPKQRPKLQPKDSIQISPQPQKPQTNARTFNYIQYPESEEEQDFLDQIDEVLNNADEGQLQPTRREVMLNFKINQLKIICKNMKNANKVLHQRIKELEQPVSEIKSESSREGSQSDLTIIQQDFTELEEELAEYKSQLNQYQHNISHKMRQKDYEIDYLRKQLNEIKNERANLQQEISEKDRIVGLLQRKNQELLLQVDQQRQKLSSRDTRKYQNYFDHKISNEMESMIAKLLKQLKFEKKTTTKHIAEIKRLNSQLLEMEGVLKQKNKQIYELEFQLIKVNKSHQKKEQTLSFREKQRHFQKSQYYESSTGYQAQAEDLSPYVPQRTQRANNLMSPKRSEQYTSNNKNRSIQSNRSYDKNRMSAEREGVRAGVGVSSLTKSLSFTLMDLLKREFKVRHAEKVIIVCRIIDLYSRKIMQEQYENLTPEQIEIYNFSSQNPLQIKVRANSISNKGTRQQTSQRGVLYNMAYILDTLLYQVQVVDAFVQNSLDLNINEYVSQLQLKGAKQQKYKFLQQLGNNIESYYIST